MIFAFLTVVAAVAVLAGSSSSSSPDPLFTQNESPYLVTDSSSLPEKNDPMPDGEADEPVPYIVTDRGLYMSGPNLNDSTNTVLTMGYLTAIKGDLKDKQGLAISGAITIAIDEVSRRSGGSKRRF